MSNRQVEWSDLSPDDVARSDLASRAIDDAFFRNAGMQLWLAYCDKKMELEQAEDELTRLRAEVQALQASVADLRAYGVELEADVEALRGFAQDLIETDMDFVMLAARQFGLLDASGQPTKLLRGE